MLRFNKVMLLWYLYLIIFQYILCYGSTRISQVGLIFVRNFNTSYVTVQQTPISDALKIKRDFNTSYVTVQHETRLQHDVKSFRFQYILCYGSTCPLFGFPNNEENFNTSYVTVQRFSRLPTSITAANFNTSYVTVQQQKSKNRKGKQEISIHLMLRFNSCHRNKKNG